MALIKDIAQICKSKNAGPFSVTIDVLFEDHELYQKVKATGVLNAELVGELYNVDPAKVLFTPYDTASAFKMTFPRAISAGDIGDTDVYGAQQHAPMLTVDIPL